MPTEKELRRERRYQEDEGLTPPPSRPWQGRPPENDTPTIQPFPLPSIGRPVRPINDGNDGPSTTYPRQPRPWQVDAPPSWQDGGPGHSDPVRMGPDGPVYPGPSWRDGGPGHIDYRPRPWGDDIDPEQIRHHRSISYPKRITEDTPARWGPGGRPLRYRSTTFASDKGPQPRREENDFRRDPGREFTKDYSRSRPIMDKPPAREDRGSSDERYDQR